MTTDILQSIRPVYLFDPDGNVNSSLDPWTNHAARVIKDTYGDTVLVKPKNLLKFGQNPNVGTSETTVMELAGSEIAETYVSTNIIDTISSDDGDNTQAVKIEGHTIDGNGNLTFVVQSATLNGQNKVTLGTPLARATRIYNNSGTVLAANSKVYVYEDSAITTGTPDDDTKVHLIMSAGEEQSLKAATAFSKVDYGLVTSIYGGVNKKTSALVDIRLKIREKNGVFRTQFLDTVNSAGSGS